MKTRAAMDREPNTPPEIESRGRWKARFSFGSLRLASVIRTRSRFREVLEGLLPNTLGHEGCGVVEGICPSVTVVAVGDHVIPLCVPEGPNCPHIKSGETNLFQTI